MSKIQLTPKQVLEWIILGIKNERYQAAMDLAQDCINIFNEQDDKIPERYKRKLTFDIKEKKGDL